MSAEIAVWRILGNDLPPRHRTGQTRENLQFLVSCEPELSGAKRHWLVNRIVDRRVEGEILELLERAGERYLHLPFDRGEYLDSLRLDLSGYPLANELHAPADRHRHRQCLYVMNLNAARNLAIETSRPTARWILPLDGNCCFTAIGWANLKDKLDAQSTFDRCFAIPMYRLAANSDFQNFTPDPASAQEPQLVVGRDSDARFHPLYRYGRYSKVELLRRLQFPYLKEAAHKVVAPEALCGYVTRLESGVPLGDGHWESRAALRENGIDRLLSAVDQLIASPVACDGSQTFAA